MLKVEIFDGDIGSVRNQMNKWFSENNIEIVSITQSSTGHRMVVITIIYKNNAEERLQMM